LKINHLATLVLALCPVLELSPEEIINTPISICEAGLKSELFQVEINPAVDSNLRFMHARAKP
jgi:hypothetical protein